MTTSTRESRRTNAVKGVLTWSAGCPSIARRGVARIYFHLALRSSPALATDTGEGIFDKEYSMFSYKKMLVILIPSTQVAPS